MNLSWKGSIYNVKKFVGKKGKEKMTWHMFTQKWVITQKKVKTRLCTHGLYISSRIFDFYFSLEWIYDQKKRLVKTNLIATIRYNQRQHTISILIQPNPIYKSLSKCYSFTFSILFCDIFTFDFLYISRKWAVPISLFIFLIYLL